MYGTKMVCKDMCKNKANRKKIVYIWLDEHKAKRLGLIYEKVRYGIFSG